MTTLQRGEISLFVCCRAIARTAEPFYKNSFTHRKPLSS